MFTFCFVVQLRRNNLKPRLQSQRSTLPDPQPGEHQPQLQSVRDSLAEDVVVPVVVVLESLWLVAPGPSELPFRSARSRSHPSSSLPSRSRTTPPARTARRRTTRIILDSEGVSDVVSPASLPAFYLHIIVFPIQVSLDTGSETARTRRLKVRNYDI